MSNFHVSATETGLAVNASTLGMAVNGPLTALLASGISRRSGIWLSLAILAAPTAGLAFAPDLPTYAMSRILQVVFMAGAFTLTLAHFSEL